jgi:hypothetical protein
MRLTIDISDNSGIVPKRGDLLHTNVGDRRERTCMILSVRRLKPVIGLPRFKLWAERWWQLEPEFRMRLFRSAERNGGQALIRFKRHSARKKPSFESYMQRKVGA